MQDLTLVNVMNSFGSTAGMTLEVATYAVSTGRANTVACVFADVPLQENVSSSVADGDNRTRGAAGMAGRRTPYGVSARTRCTCSGVRRHMHGRNDERPARRDRCRPARVGAEEPARAEQKLMMTEDYYASRRVAEPFHLFDCGLVSNGAVAGTVTSADRAATSARSPSTSAASARVSPARTSSRVAIPGEERAELAGPQALRQAGTTSTTSTPKLYDCYT